MKTLRLAVVVMAFLLAPAYAVTGEVLADPGQEARAVVLGEELRCVVCQSETINDSQADMARDMRILVREKITEGWSDAQILDFMHSRYGDFILLKPPFQMNTYVLWMMPVMFLVLAAFLVSLLFRRRKERSREG
jgi:cytochrome c-type biogenesis protein CcmH